VVSAEILAVSHSLMHVVPAKLVVGCTRDRYSEVYHLRKSYRLNFRGVKSAVEIQEVFDYLILLIPAKLVLDYTMDRHSGFYHLRKSCQLNSAFPTFRCLKRYPSKNHWMVLDFHCSITLVVVIVFEDLNCTDAVALDASVHPMVLLAFGISLRLLLVLEAPTQQTALGSAVHAEAGLDIHPFVPLTLL